MAKHSQIVLAMVVVLSLILTACGPVPAAAPAAPAQPEAATEAPAQEAATAAPAQEAAPQGEAIGVGGDATGVVYEKKASLFGGKPIKLTLWDWHTPRIQYWEQKTKEYTQMYPNVTFEITQIPSNDFWTKLTAALPARPGPRYFPLSQRSSHTFYQE